MAVYIPLIYNNSLTGYFNLVFEIGSIIYQEAIIESFLKYSYQLYYDKNKFNSNKEDFDLHEDFAIHKSVYFYGIIIDLYVLPSSEDLYDVSFTRSIPLFVLYIFIAIFVFSLSNQLTLKNQQLGREFKQREKVQGMIAENKKLTSLGTLAGGIAHDFNNILMGILANISLLEYDLNSKSELSSEYKESIDWIKDTIETSKELTSNILHFSRKSDQVLNQINLNDTIEKAIEFVGKTSNRKLHMEYKGNKDITIMANATNLLQVFMNIILNSIDINTGWIKINSSIINTDKLSDIDYSDMEKIYNVLISKENHIQIIFEDNGIGMTEDQIDQIFDPFYTTKELGKGTGLGMSIAQQIITNMNGNIICVSTFGVGTSIIITLPNVISKVNIKDNKYESILDINPLIQLKYPILIVEDEESIRSSLVKLMKSRNINAISVIDGYEAMKQIDHREFEFIILDVNMPKMSGIDLY